jgi:predicted ArsR family transcriptional regulator
MLSGLKRNAKALGTLEDDLRRSLYVYVRAQGRPVSREEAAEHAGISRKLAAFHLDKLVDRGLLTYSYARPPGRGGRGAGRSAKYYEPSSREIDVTIPERRYDLLGSVFLRALRSRKPDESGDDRELVCGMNERLVEGIVRGLGNETLDVVLDQVPGECCVRVDLPPRR